MVRRTLEGFCADQGVVGRKLHESLKTLKDSGTIDGRLFDWAQGLRALGVPAVSETSLGQALGGSPRRAVVDRPASPDGDKVERPTGRTTLAPSGEAGSPCGARRGDPLGPISEEGRGSGQRPEVFKVLSFASVAGRPGRCRPEVASRPGPGRRGPLAGRLDP
ncbi:DUF4145 domain-containing protein [Micromonospora sp. IBHARD004]|uniref:DUF4145 domain-containing protein n=1 Tax=Micromonospora sp. IBHARD004 TaxID=3457764 RepID=UPI0040581F0B